MPGIGLRNPKSFIWSGESMRRSVSGPISAKEQDKDLYPIWSYTRQLDIQRGDLLLISRHEALESYWFGRCYGFHIFERSGNAYGFALRGNAWGLRFRLDRPLNIWLREEGGMCEACTEPNIWHLPDYCCPGKRILKGEKSIERFLLEEGTSLMALYFLQDRLQPGLERAYSAQC